MPPFHHPRAPHPPLLPVLTGEHSSPSRFDHLPVGSFYLCRNEPVWIFLPGRERAWLPHPGVGPRYQYGYEYASLAEGYDGGGGVVDVYNGDVTAAAGVSDRVDDKGVGDEGGGFVGAEKNGVADQDGGDGDAEGGIDWGDGLTAMDGAAADGGEEGGERGDGAVFAAYANGGEEVVAGKVSYGAVSDMDEDADVVLETVQELGAEARDWELEQLYPPTWWMNDGKGTFFGDRQDKPPGHLPNL